LLGFLLHLGMQNAFEMAGIFAISAMSAALLSKTGKIGTATGYLTAMTIAVLYMGSLKDMGIGDIFAAPLLFAVLPEKTHIKIGSHINEIMNEEISKDSKKIAVKLKTVAKAVCDLGDGVKIISGNSPSYKEEMLFAGIMSRMCDDCKFGKMCFGKEAKYLAMEEMKRALEQDGFLNEENIPQKFKGICIRWAQFSEEFCHMYEMYKQDTVHIGETVNDRDIIAKQYGELSKMIAVLSDGLCRDRQEYDEDELTFSVRVAVCQESKDNGAENGDTVTHFRKNDKYYVILCDGMGVGSTAKEESSLTAHLFEEFIKAGIEKQSVISIINSTLALKVDRESFSSVDLLEIDLIKGDATFLKIGSAQSYVKSGNNIETITSTALPIGILENIEVKEQQIKLKRNDIVLMVSDGVDEAKSGVKKNEWIKKILTETEENDFETAHKIIVGAKSRAQEGDDVTSIVIRIMKGCG